MRKRLTINRRPRARDDDHEDTDEHGYDYSYGEDRPTSAYSNSASPPVDAVPA